jgi:hypothetical protein
LTAAEAGRAGELAVRCLDDDRAAADRAALVEHYLGSADGEDSLTRFIAACGDLLARRDAERAALAGATR